MEGDTPRAIVRPNPDLWSVQQTVLVWTREAADIAIEVFLKTKHELESKAAQIGPAIGALHPLTVSCTYTSESVLLLIGSVKPWDADVLLRSVIEGTAKFLHIAHGSPEDRLRKVREYDVDLPETNRIKRHKRVEVFLANVPNPNADEWRPLRELLLQDQVLHELETKYPRKVRQELDSRWSFGGIVAEMERIPDHPYREMRHMWHSYGMSSHVLHQDSDGVGIVTDRIARDAQRREAVTLAHCGRVASDVVAMALMRAYATALLTEPDPKWIAPLAERYLALVRKMEPASTRFHDVEYGPADKAV